MFLKKKNEKVANMSASQRRGLMIIISLITLMVAGLVIGCSDFVTKSKSTQQDNTFEITIHEYLLKEFWKRYDFSKIENAISENHHLLVNRSGSIDEYLTIKFFADNIESFRDDLLFADIAKKASKLYSVHVDVDMINLFSQEGAREFIDYDQQYGGMNLLLSDKNAVKQQWLNRYEKNIKNRLSINEQAHYEDFLNFMYSGVSIGDAIAYLESTKIRGSFSEIYSEFLDFAYNNYSFYEEEKDINATAAPATDDANAMLDALFSCSYCSKGPGPNTCFALRNHKIHAYTASGYSSAVARYLADKYVK